MAILLYHKGMWAIEMRTGLISDSVFRPLSGLVVLICLVFVSARAEAQTSVPYTIGGGGFYLIDVTVNEERSFKFIVDTAAQNTSLYPVAVAALGLQPKKASNSYVIGANGITKAKVYTVNKIDVGGEYMESFDVFVTPNTDTLSNIGGILGLDFLSRFAIEFNSETSTILFHQHNEDIQSIKEPGSTVSLQRLKPGFLSFEAVIDGVAMIAILDTGARRKVINWRAAKKIGIGRFDRRLYRDEPIVGAAGKKVRRVRKFDPDLIAIGDVVWTDQSVTVADLHALRALGLSRKPVAILGARLFENRHFIVDYQNLELVFLAN